MDCLMGVGADIFRVWLGLPRLCRTLQDDYTHCALPRKYISRIAMWYIYNRTILGVFFFFG
uniref:Uncharacterized protein n=1 Tax=Rhizophora mucronata TaxID=61149 RepID=A0A2P2LNB3_RHIMU